MGFSHFQYCVGLMHNELIGLVLLDTIESLAQHYSN